MGTPMTELDKGRLREIRLLHKVTPLAGSRRI